MILSENNSRHAARHRWYKIIGIIVVTLLLLPSPKTARNWIVQHGFVAHSTDSDSKNKQLVSAVLSAPINYFSASATLPELQLDIKYQDWMKIVADRKTGLQLGHIPDQRAEVKAQLRYLDNKLNAKIRLQGDLLDHIEAADRWSLRVELKGKNSILGVKRFALLSPNVRGNHAPNLFAETLKIAGFDIISPKHIPINLIINGTNWGVMLLEEVFSKELLANNNRTEGIILKIEKAKNTKFKAIFRPKVFQRKSVISDSSLNQQRAIAVNLLNDFLNNQRTASDVFDNEKLGQYLATVDLWSAWHALSWNNLRFYYNPHTAKLEPIQSDEALSPVPDKILLQPVSAQFPLIQSMLSDPLIKKTYDNALTKLVNITINGQLLTLLQDKQTQLIARMQQGAPLLQPYDLSILVQHAECLQSGCPQRPTMPTEWHQQLSAFSSELPWDLVSRFVSHNQIKQLKLQNNNQNAVTVIDMQAYNKLGAETDLLLQPALPFSLASNSRDSSLITKQAGITQLTLLTQQATGKLQTYNFPLNNNATQFLPRPRDVALPAFAFLDIEKNTWQIKPGDWLINDYLITPENTQVIMPAGTKLRFTQSGGMLIFGQLNIQGTANNPVTLTAEDKQPWQGISVFGSGSKSHINHLEMAESGSPKQGNWQPRGAFYFYDVNLTASNVLLRDNRSEDALNMINSRFDISKLTIKNAFSDGFDCDFCQGEIKDSSFDTVGIRAGGDAIDISGSQITVINNRFNDIRDKAISAGERSEIKAKHLIINNAAFGVVAKDGSVVIASKIIAKDIKHYLFMAYMKKPLFGGAELQANDFNCTNCTALSMLQKNNKLVLNGKSQTAKKLNVKKLYSGSMRSNKPK